MSDASGRLGLRLDTAAQGWRRISPRLVPFLAVLTAFLIGIPFIIFTSASGNVAEGLRVAGLAYSALIEGATGFVVNDLVSPDNLNVVSAFASDGELTRPDLNRLARSIGDLGTVGSDNLRRYSALLEKFDLTDEEWEQLGASVAGIAAVGVETLNAARPLIADLMELRRSEVRTLAESFTGKTVLTPEDRAAVEAVAPSAADLSDADLLRYMQLVNEYGIVSLNRFTEQVDTLAAQGITPGSPEAADIAVIAERGASTIANLVAIQARLDEVGIVDGAAAAEQIQLVSRLYDGGVLTNENVAEALETELDTALVNNLVVRRARNQVLIDHNASANAGIIYNAAGKADHAYLRLGGSVLLFFPSNLEAMLVRSIPFIVAGLAVTLGFKAGLFNIGAEGQVYIGATLAVWVGYSPIFAAPQILHLPLLILAGMLGGFLWGAIPGLLKAYTGAHEVINTIMLNFVAVLLVDWLIKSTNPIIMLDPRSSTPQTPVIAPTAHLPVFSDFSPVYYVIIGVIVALALLMRGRKQITQDGRAVIRPLAMGTVIALGGLLLSWITVRDSLHVGLLIMVAAVWLTDWFLTRTTPGFELRTVGANPNAARYAGMSVARNTVLALALSGMLAGLAGSIQVSGVLFKMQPGVLANLGFDAIAVALLARTQPRNMIFAGLLWGGLLTGTGLMQVNANLSVDLVRIIQALIIMFIAADIIIRSLWRVPKASEKDKQAATFSKGWGS